MSRSRFLRRTALMMTSTSSLVAFALALVLVGAFALRFVEKPSRMRIAVGPTDSADTKFGEALGRELPKSFGSSSVKLVRLDSLSDVSDAIDQDKAELAVVRTDVAMPQKAGTMLVVHRDAALFLVPPESKIAGFDDLEGKKIGIVPGEAANVALLDTVLTQNGVDTDKVTHVPLAPDKLAAALAAKEVDAVVALGPIGSERLEKVVAAMSTDDKPPVFLPVKNADALEQGLYGFVKVDVPSGLFAGSPPQPEDDLTTVGVDYQLVARLDISEASIDVLTRNIFAIRRLLATTAPIANFMQAPDTEKGSRFPLHVGATSYYQDTEKSFMDRYGDWFYIVAMVLGGVGSAVASLISSMQTRSRRRAMSVIDHLAELRRKAADCTDVAALRAVDREVSELALSALARAREGRFDQAGLEIVRLGVDETRRTITRRLSDVRSAQMAGPREAVSEAAQ